jgi:hypothetical protein
MAEIEDEGTSSSAITIEEQDLATGESGLSLLHCFP